MKKNYQSLTIFSYSALRLFSILSVSVALLSGCASLESKDKKPYFNAAFYDKNTPPPSMQPPSYGDTSNPVLNPTYMSSQSDYHFALAESYSLEGLHEKAIEEFKLTLVYDAKSSLVRLRLAAEYVKTGLISEALEQVEYVVKRDPKNIDARLLLGGLYSTLRMHAPAIEQYDHILKIDPENTEAPLFIGAIYAEQGKYDEAVVYFKNLVKSSTFKLKHLPHFYLGRIYIEQGGKEREKKAEAAFQQSLKQKPDYIEAILSLGLLYQRQERTKKSIKVLSRFQRKYGPSIKVAETLAQVYLEEENYDKAYEQLEIVEAKQSDNLNVKVKLALILIERKNYSKAIIKLEEVLAQAPDSDKIRFYLGAVYEELNEHSAAIENFLSIPSISSFYSESIVHAAYLQKLTGKLDDAIATVKKGIHHRDDISQFYTLYASLLDDKKDYFGAVKMLEGAVQKFPEHPQMRFFLGSMYDKVGNLEKTVEQMSKVLEIDENHVQAINYLAYTYAENNINLDKAEALARKALSLQPNDGYIMDTLGWVLYKKGKTSESIVILEAAFKIQSRESIIAEHLGDAYYHEQLVKQARFMYQKAIEVEKDEKKLQKIREKIFAIDEQYTDIEPRKPASKSRP